MSKKNWNKLFNKKSRTHKNSFNFNNKQLDDIVDFGAKAYKFDGKRWKESKEDDEQELEISDSYTVNNSDSFASSKALHDLNAKVASDLTSIYTKGQTDAKIVALSPLATKAHVDGLAVNAGTLDGISAGELLRFDGDGSQLTGIDALPTSDVASRGSALVSDGEGGSFWAYIGRTGTGSIDNTSWRYRSIYTHGYLAGGYKGSNVWRSLNKTWHNTDTTLYCGEQLHSGSSYQNGIWSDHNAYVTCGAGTITSSNSGSGKLVSSYSLHNGSQRHHNNSFWGVENAPYGYTGHNPVGDGVGLTYGSAGYGGDLGGMGLNTDRQGAATGQNIKGQAGYITGGGSTTSEKMHFATEIMYAGPDFGNSTSYLDGASGELTGWFFNNKKITWSNDSISAWSGYSGTAHKWYMSTKHGHHYAQDGSTTKRKFSDSTGSSLSTFNKVTSYNEENPEDGQDHGYILGHFNGQQNNWTIKQSYTVDTEVTMGAQCQPKGHFGQSSACCSTAAATVTASAIGV